MKTTSILTAFVGLIFATSLLQAQSADEIVSKTVLASGGKAVYDKLNSLSIESTTQVMGNEMPTTTYIVYGKGYKNVSDMGDQKIIQCYSDKGGWTINPMSGDAPQPVPPNQYKAGKLQFEIGGPLYNYIEKGTKIELVGKELVGQQQAYNLKLVTKDSAEFNYFIDTASFHVIQTLQKSDMMGQEVIIKTKLSDYRPTDFGYVMPFAMDMEFGDQFSLSVAVKKVEANQPIDPSIFDMPK